RRVRDAVTARAGLGGRARDRTDHAAAVDLAGRARRDAGDDPQRVRRGVRRRDRHGGVRRVVVRLAGGTGGVRVPGRVVPARRWGTTGVRAAAAAPPGRDARLGRRPGGAAHAGTRAGVGGRVPRRERPGPGRRYLADVTRRRYRRSVVGSVGGLTRTSQN